MFTLVETEIEKFRIDFIGMALRLLLNLDRTHALPRQTQTVLHHFLVSVSESISVNAPLELSYVAVNIFLFGLRFFFSCYMRNKSPLGRKIEALCIGTFTTRNDTQLCHLL